MVEKRRVSRYGLRSSVRPLRTAATAKYSTMKAFAHLSPTVPAIFVAAMGIALSVFLLPGAWVQGEPSPLVAVVGGAAGRVAADLPVTVNKRASQPARKAASSAQLASTRSQHVAPRRQQAATKTHRVQRHARTGSCGQATFRSRAGGCGRRFRNAGDDEPGPSAAPVNAQRQAATATAMG